MSIRIKVKGDYKRTTKYLKDSKHIFDEELIEPIANDTIEKLKVASPDENVANSWSYEIIINGDITTLYFNNSYIVNGNNIAIVIQEGHATKSGEWVQGTRYLDEPMQEAYDAIISKAMEELNKV